MKTTSIEIASNRLEVLKPILRQEGVRFAVDRQADRANLIVMLEDYSAALAICS